MVVRTLHVRQSSSSGSGSGSVSGCGSGSGSGSTYRLTWHKLNTIASRTRYTNTQITGEN